MFSVIAPPSLPRAHYLPNTSADTNSNCIYTLPVREEGRSRRGGASFRRADAAQVCNHAGFVAVDGAFECSVATAARQIVKNGERGEG